MTITSVVQDIPVANPPGQFSVITPSKGGTFIGVRLSNYSPFTLIISGVNDDAATQPILQPYQTHIFPYKAMRGNLTFTPNTIPGSPTLPTNMNLVVEFADAPEDLHGAYPASLPGQGFTSVQGDIVIGTITGDVNIGTVSGIVSTVDVSEEALFQHVTGATTYTYHFDTPYRYLIIVVGAILSMSGAYRIRVRGDTTGVVYYDFTNPNSGTQLVDYGIVVPEVETGFTVTVNTVSNSDNFSLGIVAAAAAPVNIPTNNHNIAQSSTPLQVAVTSNPAANPVLLSPQQVVGVSSTVTVWGAGASLDLIAITLGNGTATGAFVRIRVGGVLVVEWVLNANSTDEVELYELKSSGGAVTVENLSPTITIGATGFARLSA